MTNFEFGKPYIEWPVGQKGNGINRMIRLRVIVVDPPPGVAFQMQRGRFDLLAPSLNRDGVISFNISLRLGTTLTDGRPNFLGEFAHGTPHDRFLYVNSGSRAGQPDSCWDRRAKVKLSSIDNALIERVLADTRGVVLEARFLGTARDGGPSCATVPLLDGGWTLVRN